MSRAWIAFYMGDYQKKTSHLTTEQHGAYFLLLQHCWMGLSLPKDDRSRAVIARVSFHKWKNMCGVINSFFDEDGFNKRALEEIAKAEEISTKRAMAGQKGGFRSGITKAIAKQTGSKRVAFATAGLQQTPKQKPSNCIASHKEKIITTSESGTEGATEKEKSGKPRVQASSYLVENLRGKGLVS
jgi:uncharacterized protein YdaU (DUF1376 family)